ncbi:MAG: SAM-dependent methyltransferase [Nitrospira sp. CG24E]|nr:MAG: SAM-dependent methyltransferase [Nitrospira sp. CG24E]
MSVTAGHPELISAIASEIAFSGPIPFVRFMELALYHSQFGYYMRRPDGIGRERIGWSGDFYTSSDVFPMILGRTLAAQARQMDELLACPTPFTIVEMGAGKGLLARDVLTAIHSQGDSFASRVRYILIERSPAMRELQCRNLAPWLSKPGLVTWVEGLDGLAPETVTGLFLSNELVDAFPVHRIQVTAGRTDELYVDYRDGRFVDCPMPLSTTRIAEYLQRLQTTLPEGYRTEVNLHAMDWMEQVAQQIDRGFVVTIDYGHTAQDLYGSERKNGTFLCYFQQLTNEDPFMRVGEQDMTAHVDFSSLAAVGEEQGLHVTGFTNQMSFLMGLGVEEMIGELEPESPEFQAAIHLLRPDGMGSTFKVLIQHKGLSRPELDGLKFKPFFGSALAASRARGERHEAMGQNLTSSRSPLAPSLQE